MTNILPFTHDFKNVRAHHAQPQTQCVQDLLKEAQNLGVEFKTTQERANQWVDVLRKSAKNAPFIEAFMQHYSLSTHEGLMLMSLAEALLRVPDTTTIDLLIQDKLDNHFASFLKSSSTLVNLSTFALNVVAKTFQTHDGTLTSKLKRALSTPRDPLVRRGVFWAMKLLSNKFVMGPSIDVALKRSKKDMDQGYTHSFDMLGEAALTEEDAEHYFKTYLKAIHEIAKHNQGLRGPGISIKLSALHPRYTVLHLHDIKERLGQRLVHLAKEAARANIALIIDAEESEHLELSLELMGDLAKNPQLKTWQGLGLAVQAYQKRATAVIDWLMNLAKENNRRIGVRLVKGAYWDTEIKLCQERGLDDYPVFTRKSFTDLSYVVCASKLLKNIDLFYPAFATHNAMTVSMIMTMAEAYNCNPETFEFQRLHGMGERLYGQFISNKLNSYTCRIYAPVGPYHDLLPYLVRRLLENGANSSFVNQVLDETHTSGHLNANPIEKVASMSSFSHKNIPNPRNLYEKTDQRFNAKGVDFSSVPSLESLFIKPDNTWAIEAIPLLGPLTKEKGTPISCKAPFDSQLFIGTYEEITANQLQDVMMCAAQHQDAWRFTPVTERVQPLQRAAEIIEERMAFFVRLLVMEAGKTYGDAVAEVREAIDFCRYYANRAVADFKDPRTLTGPTGEENKLYLRGRGVFACISPWNFPLAIFIGQVTAALAAGNVVIAKPASQTPLVAYEAVRVLLEAGIPEQVLYFTPMKGQDFSQIFAHKHLEGVVFTGSTQTAWSIQNSLTQRRRGIIPFIAETGGQNAMIVDASALLEQVVKDVMVSAFQSAGQRCSALRILFVQEDIAVKFKKMLVGAMDEWVMGDPRHLNTDMGPVIDEASQAHLSSYIQSLKSKGYWMHESQVNPTSLPGYFIKPVVCELPDISSLEDEKFGPILHMVTFKAQEFDSLYTTINDLGYGLTFGLHSRINQRIQAAAHKIRAGNIYINRNMIGAVVGVQPFGGQGLSGTGPKAGGPFYLHRFVTEQTVCINTAAAGGNTALMLLDEDI